MELREIMSDPSARFSVDGWRGIAFYARRAETQPDEDTDWTGIELATGSVVMIMVGDDREHVVDPDDVSVLGEDAGSIV